MRVGDSVGSANMQARQMVSAAASWQMIMFWAAMPLAARLVQTRAGGGGGSGGEWAAESGAAWRVCFFCANSTWFQIMATTARETQMVRRVRTLIAPRVFL